MVAPDLRDSGWTDAPTGTYTVEQMLDDVLVLLDTLGLGRVGLIAHDFSAFLAFRLCYNHPDRVAACVALAPHPTSGSRPACSPVCHNCGSSRSSPLRASVHEPSAATGSPSRLLTGGVANPASITEEDRATFLGRLHAYGHPKAGSALYRRLILPEMGRLAAGIYRKRRLTVPTVALMGGADPAVHEGMLDVPPGVADDLTGHVVERAGHFLADDRPDAVVAHARQLFDRVL